MSEAVARKIEPWLREIIRCPKCLGELEDVAGGYRCRNSGAVYPIKNDVPVLLSDHGEPPCTATRP